MRTRTLLPALLLLALAVSCGSDPEPVEAAPDELTGIIVSIDAEALGDVTSFELKAGDEVHVISIADDVEYGFPLGHLHEHFQTSEPVLVELEEREGKLYALSIEDA